MKACLGGCAHVGDLKDCPSECSYLVNTTDLRGLKDHQIQQMVNAIRDKVKILTEVQCLRELISMAAISYLEENGLRIDARD